MSKRNKIIYWIATLWLALGMTSTGIVQLMHREEEVNLFKELGFPIYFLTLMGICKLLGVVAILLPKLPLLKEWTYTGFFFSMSGAVFSILVSNHSIAQIFPPLLLLALTVTSWYFRPADKKMSAQKTILILQS